MAVALAALHEGAAIFLVVLRAIKLTAFAVASRAVPLNVAEMGAGRAAADAMPEDAGLHHHPPLPRDAVKLMAKLIFVPIADQISSGTYLLYYGACGTGGMLTVAEETLNELAEQHDKQVSTHLFGQRINGETYAIAKADLLLKGEGEEADNIVGGPEWSTLANDAFPSREFDFMLSNPPFGKSWKSDQERVGGKTGMRDPRFVIEHAGNSPARCRTPRRSCTTSARWSAASIGWAS